ncbi:hypothetical protein [Shinella zoogloeoides]|uniref:Uncharacterized protein n=1 Tax=Shinella zoogloeoides TaxID=352475 RepID=A0A6N8TF18_SHIZO|nr:hypothetical protein [Shinella zoogloeoides]MXO01867.1 hypothetical protein [Shinella zoogloeoides]UEX84430.1 hypothetical protein K8M09_23330 [Shinella zoogloeoides]
MQTDSIEKALAEVAACRALREKQLALRVENQRKLEAVAKPLYVLRSKKQLELRLQ